MRSYVKGRRFENYVKEKLEKKGYLVVRSAGSKGPFDLVALKKGEILLIQCKWRRSGMREEMVEAAEEAGGKPVIATHVKGRVVFLDLEGREIEV